MSFLSPSHIFIVQNVTVLDSESEEGLSLVVYKNIQPALSSANLRYAEVMISL